MVTKPSQKYLVIFLRCERFFDFCGVTRESLYLLDVALWLLYYFLMIDWSGNQSIPPIFVAIMTHAMTETIAVAVEVEINV